MQVIDHNDIARLDLNLLVALDALLTEGSVTKAARRIGVGQPAMSNSLARLREMLGDELFTRSGNTLQPTPRARLLVAPLRAVLHEMHSLLRPGDTLDPAKLTRTFRIAMPDNVEILFMPAFLARLRAEAPGVTIVMRRFERTEALDLIDAGQLDLAVGVFFEGQIHHKRRIVLREGFSCLFNADLLGVRAPISLDDYLRFPHVLTSLNETSHGLVDEILAKLGRKRQVAVTTPLFLTVPFIVKSVPMVTTMVASLAALYARLLGLELSPLPVDVGERQTSMVWHASYNADPAHRWMRNVFFEATRDAN